MKRTLLAAFIAIVCISTSQAQVSGGAKAALNIATTVSKDGTHHADARLAPTLGGYLNINLSNGFAFQPELLFSFQGSRWEANGHTYTRNYVYLNVPLMLEYHVGKVFYLEAGPQLGFLAIAKFKDKSDGHVEITDQKGNMNGTVVSLNLGLGLDFNKMHFNLRHCFGLSDIYDHDYYDDPVRNSVYQLGIGYRLF
ncbi:porin family protein [Fulvivirga ligni]|uniref:porin family protein n=1 Tax=Fulvivirga ligni TaxID=2904246 RepID=UPI001F30EEA7|nr:porin family protein [Fulvivirga ligni]UII23428.1 PorT family protein [Fulvivirga ligni]